MQVRTTSDEELGLLMVRLTGSIGRCSSHALRRVFATATDAGHLRVLVDLTGLDDVDDAVAATLLEQDEQLTARGGWLWLVHGATELGAARRSVCVSPRVRTSGTPWSPTPDGQPRTSRTRCSPGGARARGTSEATAELDGGLSDCPVRDLGPSPVH